MSSDTELNRQMNWTQKFPASNFEKNSIFDNAKNSVDKSW